MIHGRAEGVALVVRATAFMPSSTDVALPREGGKII